MEQKREKVKHDLRVEEAEFNQIQEGGQKVILVQNDGQFGVGDDLILQEVKQVVDGQSFSFVETGRTYRTFITHIIEGDHIIGLIGGYAILSLYGGGFLELAKEFNKHTNVAPHECGPSCSHPPIKEYSHPDVYPGPKFECGCLVLSESEKLCPFHKKPRVV